METAYDDLLVGAVTASQGGVPNSGYVRLYFGGPGAIATQLFEGSPTGSYFGFSVAIVGDLNGDLFADAAISAITYDRIAGDEGAIYIAYGSATGIGSFPSMLLDGVGPPDISASAWAAELLFLEACVLILRA